MPAVSEILSSDGPIARRLGADWEPRPQQLDMAAAVERALADGATLLVEAGTGVGKSFAYLLPAIRRIVEHDERVVIATNTIALQEQLLDRDVPLLQSITPEEFSAVLVKGRANYVSLRRLALASRRQETLLPDGPSRRSLHTVEDWALHTDDGSLATLPQLERPAVWDHAQSDSGNCMGRACPTYEKCFDQRARRRMEHGDLLITNHALFFADLALRSRGVGFLPPYDHVILDEAHAVEDAATDHFGVSLAERRVRRLLTTLHHDKTGAGFLSHLEVDDEGIPTVARTAEAVAAASGASTRFFEALADIAFARGGRDAAVRIPEPDALENPLTPAFNDLTILLKRLRERCRSEEDKFELNAFAERAAEIALEADALVKQSLPGCAYWVEASAPDRARHAVRVTLACSPVEVGPLLRERLFNSERSVILTSATLTTVASGRRRDDSGRRGMPRSGMPRERQPSANELTIVPEDPSEHPLPRGEGRRAAPGKGARATHPFSHIAARLGLDLTDPVVSTLALGSPFDHASQVTLFVEPSMPDPRAATYTQCLAQRILHHIRATDGGAFVLFTSFDTLNTVSRLVRPTLESLGMLTLVQSKDGPRSLLLAKFREHPRAVLLGVASFWQGVDVRGDALRNVIITRLPFEPPDRPLTEARHERIKTLGRDPFFEDSLPRAVIRFRQGFGRLIRSRTDTGRVVVLDPRLTTKPYGRAFLRALPEGVPTVVSGLPETD